MVFQRYGWQLRTKSRRGTLHTVCGGSMRRRLRFKTQVVVGTYPNFRVATIVVERKSTNLTNAPWYVREHIADKLNIHRLRGTDQATHK